ncbi:hypothetical protein OROHE_004410 [Orobanche hederae]
MIHSILHRNHNLRSLARTPMILSLAKPSSCSQIVMHSTRSWLSSPAAILKSLSSINIAIRKQSYSRFPPMVGPIPRRPKDAMDTGALWYASEQTVNSFATPNNVVVELKLTTCKNMDPTSRRPAFKVHNIRSSYESDSGRIVNLNRQIRIRESDDEFFEFLVEITKERIEIDMERHGISEAELQQLWWPEIGDMKDFWATSMLKHSWFFLDENITDYASKTFKLADPIINGTNNKPGLGEFLEMRNLCTGKYHEVTHLLGALKEFFTVDGYPNFVGHGGYHPSLFEVGVIATKDCSARISHLCSRLVSSPRRIAAQESRIPCQQQFPRGSFS